MVQRTGTLTERAHRIAEQYLDDPAQWAAKDIKGKGITLCTRSVDPSFLGTEDDPKRTRITMVQKQIKKLEGDLAANGLSPPEIQSRRDRAAHEVKKRLQAEASQAAGTSPKKTGDKYDNETGELQTGGTVADLRMRGRWKSSVVKTEAYRSAFKYATRRYAEEVQKSLAPGAKKGDWVGATAVAAETGGGDDGAPNQYQIESFDMDDPSAETTSKKSFYRELRNQEQLLKIPKTKPRIAPAAVMKERKPYDSSFAFDDLLDVTAWARGDRIAVQWVRVRRAGDSAAEHHLYLYGR